MIEEGSQRVVLLDDGQGLETELPFEPLTVLIESCK